MAEPLSAIRNIGPALEAAFQRAGIKDAETLRNLGADAGYLELLKSGVRPHFIGYYVIVMGLQGRPWNDCQGQEKRDLRARFDALKAQAGPACSAPETEIEKLLAQIGVVEKKKGRK